MRTTPEIPLSRTAWLLGVVALLATLSGCNMAGWAAHGLAGKDGKKTVQVGAEYRGLENQKVAVMVSANEFLLYEYPSAPLAVSRAVSSKLAANVPGITLVSPEEVIRFQQDNPYWAATPYRELVRRLGVDRIVLIDLGEYRTHEPGNSYVFQGLVSGTVGVIEADSEDPDQFAYRKSIQGEYPEESTIGLVEGTEEIVSLGMREAFARNVAWLFFDHEEQR